MRTVFFVVDIDRECLVSTGKALTDVFPDAEIILHQQPLTALSAVLRVNPDYYISEVCLGNTDGIALAGKVKHMCPNIWIAIMSDSCDYTLQAYRIHARSYLLKPLTAEKIKKYLFLNTE